MRGRSRKRTLPPGVYEIKPPKKRYRAMIYHFPDTIHLGTFETPEEAHKAWLSAKQRRNSSSSAMRA